MADTTIESLELEVKDNAKAAAQGIDTLTASLSKMKGATTGGAGLNAVVKQATSLRDVVKTIDPAAVGRMHSLANGVTSLSRVNNIRISSSVANQITAIGKATNGLNGVDFSAVQNLADSMDTLGKLDDARLGSTFKQLQKIPKIAEALEKTDMEDFARKIEEVTAAVKPLATEMEKVSNGFSAFPAKIQKIITQNEKLTASNKKTAGSYGVLGTGVSKSVFQLNAYLPMVKRAASHISGWIDKSMDYTENVNLFTVAMGSYAEEATNYAERVQDAMGIDMSQWMRNQGVFMQITTGFGVVEDKAYQMSKGLTQVSYDIASFFNISTDEALTKVQSGIAGELEPLRRLGYALDVATLQQVAYEHGVNKSIEAMTQAEKSQIRYIAIMEQSEHVLGDMGRTIMTPANATRILGQQTEQLQRALGDLLIPTLMDLLPYAQAGVELLTDLAQAVAPLFGVKPIEIDYSSVSGLSTAVDGVTDAYASAEEAAESFRKSTIGLDQINVLGGISAVSSLGDSASNGAVSDLGLNLSEYNYNFLKDASQDLEKIKGEVVAIMVAISPLLIGKAYSSIKKFFMESDKGLSLLRSFNSGFEGTGKIMGGLKQTFKDLYNSIDPVTKKIIGAGGVIYGFSSAKDSAYDLIRALDSGEGLGGSLLSLTGGVAAGAAGGFMVGGPIGAVIGGFASLAGVIWGAYDANVELRKEFADRAFLNDTGLDVDALTKAFKENWSGMDELESKMSSLRTSIETESDNIGNAKEKIQPLVEKINSLSTLTNTEGTELSNAVGEMVSSMKTKLETDGEAFITAFKGLFDAAHMDMTAELNAMKVEFWAFQSIFGSVVDGYESKINAIIEGAMYVKEDGTIGYKFDEGQRTQLEGLIGNLTDLTANTSSSTEKSEFDRIIGEATNGLVVDEHFDAASFLSGLSTAAKGYKTSLDNAYNTANGSIQDMMYKNDAMLEQDSISPHDYFWFATKFNDYGIKLGITHDTNVSTMNQQMSEAIDAIQRGMVSNLLKVAESARDEFETLSWYEKALYFDAEDYSTAVLHDTVNKQLPPFVESLEKFCKDVGVDAPLWIEDIVDSALDLMDDRDDSNSLLGSFVSWSDEVKNATFETALKKYLKAAGIAGYATGGFPEDGLFFANHNELVGQFSNGRTAVANNAQIIEGIKQGVMEANLMTGGGSSGGGDWVIQIVTPDGEVRAETVITAAERRNRRDGRTVIPVGV